MKSKMSQSDIAFAFASAITMKIFVKGVEVEHPFAKMVPAKQRIMKVKMWLKRMNDIKLRVDYKKKIK